MKVLVKKITKQAAFSRLLALKNTKTKMDDTSYVTQFNCQPYLNALTSGHSPPFYHHSLPPIKYIPSQPIQFLCRVCTESSRM